MEYNTQREHLPMPEYGRSVQEMVDHAIGIEDRSERQRCAETIVGIMQGMFPALKDVSDFQAKLWDHLAYMSDYRLDVDYPYPITKIDVEKQKPEGIGYSRGEVKFRHYGRIIPELIDKAASMESGPERTQLVKLIVMQMRKDLVLWNKEMNTDDRIREDLAYFSKGALQADDEALNVDLSKNMAGQGQQRPQRPFQKKKNRKRY